MTSNLHQPGDIQVAQLANGLWVGRYCVQGNDTGGERWSVQTVPCKSSHEAQVRAEKAWAAFAHQMVWEDVPRHGNPNG